MEMRIRTENGNTATYDVKDIRVVHGGTKAKAIEAATDASGLDEEHEYLVLTLENGETATFKWNHVEVLSKFEAVVTVSNWEDGQGWQYTNEVIERYEASPEDVLWASNEPYSQGWAWLCECYQNDGYQIEDGEDDEYTITYYDEEDEIVASYSVWMSDIIDYMESLDEEVERRK